MKEAKGSPMLPLYREIPDVGLYLEQVSKYISGQTESLGLGSVTGSMISNYVKKKMVAGPVKKQYGREQISELLFIAVAKSVLSIENAGLMLEEMRSGFGPEEAYGIFREVFSEVLPKVSSETGDTAGEDGSRERMLRNLLTAVSYKTCLDRSFRNMKESAGRD